MTQGLTHRASRDVDICCSGCFGRGTVKKVKKIACGWSALLTRWVYVSRIILSGCLSSLTPMSF